MKQARAAEPLEVRIAKTEAAADVDSSVSDTVGVLIGKRRLSGNDFRERETNVIDCPLVCGEPTVFGLDRQNFGVQIVFLEPPESTRPTEGNLWLTQVRG